MAYSEVLLARSVCVCTRMCVYAICMCGFPAAIHWQLLWLPFSVLTRLKLAKVLSVSTKNELFAILWFQMSLREALRMSKMCVKPGFFLPVCFLIWKILCSASSVCSVVFSLHPFSIWSNIYWTCQPIFIYTVFGE